MVSVLVIPFDITRRCILLERQSGAETGLQLGGLCGSNWQTRGAGILDDAEIPVHLLARSALSFSHYALKPSSYPIFRLTCQATRRGSSYWVGQ